MSGSMSGTHKKKSFIIWCLLIVKYNPNITSKTVLIEGNMDFLFSSFLFINEIRKFRIAEFVIPVIGKFLG
jgi:hypothetical protein